MLKEYSKRNIAETLFVFLYDGKTKSTSIIQRWTLCVSE